MTSTRPGVLAVRAINQYRRRDVVPYLALRYYLDNVAARSDHWARRAAVNLVNTRSEAAYYEALHFKEVNSQGTVEHRKLYLPGANESLAEAALLDQCAKHSDVFQNPSCVYSYQLASGEDRRGVFRPYFEGFKERHQAIADACDHWPRGVVLYTDIRRFYSSLLASVAKSSWKEHADRAKLPAPYLDLGVQLLDDYGRVSPQDKGVLTGPMFSHLLGNLVLRKLDEHLGAQQDIRYLRYVDDIVLVGDESNVKKALATIKSHLSAVGLALHTSSSPKSLQISTSEWCEGRHDFIDKPGSLSWRGFIGDLKRLLIRSPDALEELRSSFLQEGLRTPVLDYSQATQEVSYRARLAELLHQGWLRKRIGTTSVRELIDRGKKLSRIYLQRFESLVDDFDLQKGYSRKRRVPKLRYYASRLVYLAPDTDLKRCAEQAAQIQELRLFAEVMLAVSTGDIDRILPLGSNAAQAAAQPLQAAEKPVTSSIERPDEAGWQALSVFYLNGIEVRKPKSAGIVPEVIRFATKGADLELMRSSDPFQRELACLHGLSAKARHPEVLRTAFDKDEALTMDAIDQLQNYLYDFGGSG